MKKGDRVKYIGLPSDTFPRKGGILIEDVKEGYAKVQWDEYKDKYVSEKDFHGTPANAVEVIPKITKEEALAVLKTYGKVTFEPFFKPISVRLNDNHTAVVYESYVQVGCQKFRFEAILDLATEVGKVVKSKR